MTQFKAKTLYMFAAHCGLCFPRCIRHSEIFMEGYRTWEGSGGKNEREKETKRVFYFPDEKLAVATVIIAAFWQ